MLFDVLKNATQPMPNPSAEQTIEGAYASIPMPNVPIHTTRYNGEIDDIPPPKADFSAPPPYEVATKLPTYEEVQREKHLEGEQIPDPIPQTIRVGFYLFVNLKIDLFLTYFEPILACNC